MDKNKRQKQKQHTLLIVYHIFTFTFHIVKMYKDKEIKNVKDIFFVNV